MRDVSLASCHAPRRSELEASAIELWLRRGLAARYDGALQENLPSDMLALLNSANR